jgi:hypothetical protein
MLLVNSSGLCSNFLKAISWISCAKLIERAFCISFNYIGLIYSSVRASWSILMFKLLFSASPCKWCDWILTSWAWGDYWCCPPSSPFSSAVDPPHQYSFLFFCSFCTCITKACRSWKGTRALSCRVYFVTRLAYLGGPRVLNASWLRRGLSVVVKYD